MPQRSEPVYPNAKSATSFADGVEYQDFVCEALARRGLIIQLFGSKRYQLERGESLTGAEIKLDQRCVEFNHLSIEVAEKSRASIEGWTPSGILRDDNSWLYIQGNQQVIFVFAKNWLRRWYHVKKPDVHTKRGTIQTFYLEWPDALAGAAKMVDLRRAP